MFEPLGIAQTDEQIFLHLVRNGPASAAALCATLGFARRAVHTSIRRLGDAGLIQRSPAPHERIIAMPLEVAVDHLIRQRTTDLESVRDMAAILSAELRPEPQRLYDAARQELRILMRSPFALPSGTSVPVRLVVDSSLPRVSSAAQVRLSSNVPANLVLADRRTALLPLDTSAVLIRPGNLFDALDALFHAVWSAAIPFGGPPSIDANDRALLALLVAGLTDDAAGARLGMSRRTVARRVQRLMQATGAHSRLQLGWWAREREWLS